MRTDPPVRAATSPTNALRAIGSPSGLAIVNTIGARFGLTALLGEVDTLQADTARTTAKSMAILLNVFIRRHLLPAANLPAKNLDRPVTTGTASR
jgi:hypothetical protein